MKRMLTVSALVLLTLTLSATAFTGYVEKAATLSQTKFIMDGKEVTFEAAYNIESSNYIQLREVAKALSGTKSQFNVYWDNKLSQAVIETGMPYTGVAPAEVKLPPNTPQTYIVGDTIALDNATIQVTKITTADSTPPDEYGSKLLASGGHMLLCISFEVTTSGLNSNNTLWHPTQFIRYATAASGINYEGPFAQGTAGFGANVKKTATVYIEVPANETIISVVVTDGMGKSATVSVP